MRIPFDNTYAKLPEQLFARIRPEEAPNPQLLGYNQDLSDELGITETDDVCELAQVFSGASVPKGADPISLAYAGHQFGNFVPSLGDGRAVLLGEVVATSGQRFDVQLKGSGRTLFSRGGDGKAWLGPVLREYVVSEAMHHLGVPTTRALAAATTGETIVRNEGAVPGAVVTRIASSHIRVGTFQYFAARRDITSLRALFDYALNRHYPECSTTLDFLNAVIDMQSSLIAKWMSVGFIHGVMNTDNTSISGETIDYGPCAFMDRYHPATVFSSIDRHGRYAYMNQPDIVVWNLAQLASSLIWLEEHEDDAIEAFTKAINAMPALIKAKRLKLFGEKLGISDATEADAGLIEDFLTILMESEADFTNSFRMLSEMNPSAHLSHSELSNWVKRWQGRIIAQPDPIMVMNNANPVYIPRNHLIERMIQNALQGDMELFDTLNRVLKTPYVDQADTSALKKPPTEDEIVHATFCGT